MNTNSASARIGFLGLGRMGRSMAAHLVAAGHDVVIWNRTPAAMDELLALGAIAASDPSEVIATGHVFSMLANEQVLAEIFSPESLRAAPAGFIHVNHATVSARAADEFARLHHELGHAYVAAPVIGRPEVAARGELTILAAGDRAALDRSLPYLELMGKRVWEYGDDPKSANVAKIAVNLLIIHALQALAESITVLESYGLDASTFIDAINDSVFPGTVYAGYGKGIATKTYSPAGFTMTLGAKDLSLALQAAEDAGVQLPTGAVLRTVFEAGIAAGNGDLDWSSIAEFTRAGANGEQK